MIKRDLDILRPYLDNGFVITTDDLCLSNLEIFKYWDKVKEKYPELKIIAFTIANYKEQEPINESKEFKEWFEEHKDWVEIGVHGYDHELPNECFRDNQEEYFQKSLEILKDFIPKNPLYRPPGFKYVNWTENILKKYFSGIAHQDRIKYFNGTYKKVFNTHCTLEIFEKPIGRIWKNL